MTYTSRPARRGFTLIELLVVISIIALMSSVVLASVNSGRLKARNAERLETIDQYRNALELARDADGSYPSSPSTACLGTYTSACGNGAGVTLPSSPTVNAALARYLPSLPGNPPAPPYVGISYWTCAGSTATSCTRWNAPNDTYILEWYQEGASAPCGIGFSEFAPDPNWPYTWCAYVHR